MHYKDQPRYPTTIMTVRRHDLELLKEALELMYDHTLTIEQRDHINHWFRRIERASKILTKKQEHDSKRMILGSSADVE